MNKISVIVPVYNSEKFIERCLKSIINQTYQNLEIIVINDGSTDNSEEIIKKICERDSRVLLINQNNLGVSEARNKGLSSCTGDYITFVDSDDYIADNMYELMIRNIKNSDDDIIECNFLQVNLAGVTLKKGNLNEEKIIGTHEILKKYLNKENTYNYLWNKIYKRELIENLRFGNFSYSEDYLFNIQAIMNSKVKVTISDVLYYYSNNPDGAVNKNFTRKKMDIIFVAKEAIDFVKGSYLDLLPYCYEYILDYSIVLCLEISKNKNFEVEYKYLLNEFHSYYSKLSTEFPKFKMRRNKRIIRRLFNKSPYLALLIVELKNKKFKN